MTNVAYLTAGLSVAKNNESPTSNTAYLSAGLSPVSGIPSSIINQTTTGILSVDRFDHEVEQGTSIFQNPPGRLSVVGYGVSILKSDRLFWKMGKMVFKTSIPRRTTR